jgi:hypothetical protein
MPPLRWTPSSIVKVAGLAGFAGLAVGLFWWVLRPERSTGGGTAAAEFSACATSILTKEKSVDRSRAGEISSQVVGMLTKVTQQEKVVESKVPLDADTVRRILDACRSLALPRSLSAVEVSRPQGVRGPLTVHLGDRTCTIGVGQTSCTFLLWEIEDRGYAFTVDDDRYVAKVAVRGPALTAGVELPVAEPSFHEVYLTPARAGVAELTICAKQGRIACEQGCGAPSADCKRASVEGRFGFSARADLAGLHIEVSRGKERGVYDQEADLPRRIEVPMKGPGNGAADTTCPEGPEAFRTLQVLRKVNSAHYRSRSIEVEVEVRKGKVARVTPVTPVTPVADNDLAPVVAQAVDESLGAKVTGRCTFRVTWRPK